MACDAEGRLDALQPRLARVPRPAGAAAARALGRALRPLSRRRRDADADRGHPADAGAPGRGRAGMWRWSSGRGPDDQVVLVTTTRSSTATASCSARYVAMHDITERKRDQTALEEATRHRSRSSEPRARASTAWTATRHRQREPGGGRLTGYRVIKLIGRDLDGAARGRGREARTPSRATGAGRRRLRRRGVPRGAGEAGAAGVVVFRDVTTPRAQADEGGFVALASRELRSPLTSIATSRPCWTGRAASSAPAPAAARRRDRNAKRLARLVTTC